MTDLLFENFADYSGTRDSRVLALARARADEGLAGRSVWYAMALASSAGRARALQGCVPAARRAGLLQLAPEEPLRRIARRLDAMLARAGADALDRADADELGDAILRGERIAGEEIGSGDVVVLDDPLGLVLAPALRERGAHAVLYVRPGSAHARATVGRAAPVLRPCGAAVDARVMVWRERGRVGAKRIAALITSGDVVAAKEITARGLHPDEICWTTMLAEIVERNHGETVGGRMHVRPTVAPR
jgi:hypothetical protein